MRRVTRSPLICAGENSTNSASEAGDDTALLESSAGRASIPNSPYSRPWSPHRGKAAYLGCMTQHLERVARRIERLFRGHGCPRT
jgi:hypothetical protein